MASREYYEARERTERSAADKAACPEARMAHDDLARAYARLAQAAESEEQQPDA